MDFQIKKLNRIPIFYYVLFILVFGLLFFNQPLFSNKPLGLDATGHLSKIAYMQEYKFPSWNMGWYAGVPFLNYYSPLYYYCVSAFDNYLFFNNFFLILSLVLTSVGVFLLVNYYHKNKALALICSLFFYTILNSSYYYIAVGNNPFIFSIFTIPFALLFFELSRENKYWKLFSFLLSILICISILSHIFTAVILIGLIGIRALFFIKKDLSFFIRTIIYVGLGVLLSGFWLFPFFEKSSNFSGNSDSYVPSFSHLLGLGNYTIWGVSPGEIGIVFLLFIVLLVLLLFKIEYIEEKINLRFNKKFLKSEQSDNLFLSYLCICLFLFAMLFGLLGNFYPTGVGAERFILPTSVILCVVLSFFFKKIKSSSFSIILLLLVLLLGLIWNYNTLSLNYKQFSYSSLENDRAGFVQSLPLEVSSLLSKNFSNYRFGTDKFIFGESLNMVYPGQSQTQGYYYQGVLYQDTWEKMREAIWEKEDINQTLFYLSGFGIKYFEIDLGKSAKFVNCTNLKKVYTSLSNSYNYPYVIYEYLDASPILSLVQSNINPNDFRELSFSREHPDRIFININENTSDSYHYLLFKESYHESWVARDSNTLKSIKIEPTDLDMMVLDIGDSKSIELYQNRTRSHNLGIIVSLISLLILVIFIARSKK